MDGAHPAGGTCDDSSCPQHGLCHCGCGRPTTVAATNRRTARYPWTMGEPMVWLPGHWRPWEHSTGYWARQGVSTERVAPLVRWLVAVYGSQRLAAEALELPMRWVTGICRDEHSRCAPDRARRVAELVMAHRRGQPGLFDEVAQVRLPTAKERAERAGWDAEHVRSRRNQQASRARRLEAG